VAPYALHAFALQQTPDLRSGGLALGGRGVEGRMKVDARDQQECGCLPRYEIALGLLRFEPAGFRRQGMHVARLQ